jgi:hypothetical protein
MQDTELFMELAGIAGVFVGFGALIAVRSGGASDPFEVAFVRGVVVTGLLTVIAALAPVTLDRYELAEHQVWALSSALVLVCLFVLVVAMVRMPEWAAAGSPLRARRLAAVVEAGGVLYLLALIITPALIVLGVAPQLDAALYFTAVVLILLFNGWLLLRMVFRGRGTSSA